MENIKSGFLQADSCTGQNKKYIVFILLGLYSYVLNKEIILYFPEKGIHL